MEVSKAKENVEGLKKRQFCSFWLAERLFGVDIIDVKEINRVVSFTPIFHAPDEIRGYVNIRGQIHLVLDLRLLMGFEKGEIFDSSRVVLFKPTVGESFGVLVDKISDVVEVDESVVENRRKTDQNGVEMSDLERRRNNLAAGVCKMENNLLVVLKAEEMLSLSGPVLV